MPLKIDETVLRKTEIFRKILDDKNRRAGVAPTLAKGLRFEYSPPVPREGKQALDSFGGLGVCLRGDHVVKHSKHKTPDLITGGFLSAGNAECVCLAECKFNAKNPGRFFGNAKAFRDQIADKFLVITTWKICAPEKKCFILFSKENAEKAKARLRNFRKASKGSADFTLAETLTVCDLAEFRTFFA